MKIPQEFLDDFKTRKGLVKPVFSVRVLTDIQGNIGETYILVGKDSLLFYSGKFSEEYKYFEYSFTDIRNLRIEQERPFAYLIFEVHSQSIRLKCAIFDLKSLDKISECWKQIHETSQGQAPVVSGTTATYIDRNSAAQNTSTPELNPMLGFCAVLQALVHVDSDLAEEERKKLTLIIGNPQLLKEGREYWQKVGTEQLISNSQSILSPPQKICLLANMLEVAMVDGVLHESEKAFIETLRKSLAVGAKEFNTIFDVLLAKNNLTIF